MSERSSSDDQVREPAPDSDAKADDPTDLKGPSWKYTFKRAAQEFGRDELTDKAAALTYYAVLSIFPALIALVSMLGVFGQGQATTDALTGMIEEYAPQDVASQLEGPISSITESPGAGIGLLIGLLTALWTASNYVNAFSRAMNGIYEVEEGRPFWKLRPVMYLLTAVLILIIAIALVILVVSGPVAQAAGDMIGLGSTAVMVWRIAKWPVLVLIVVLALALLYYFTPNVQQPKFKWVSPGAGIALLVAAIATVGFVFYVVNFGNYNATYGALAGIIIFLLWLWIMNVVLLFGAEVDAEMERSRQLQSGIPAEEDIQLPLRDDSQIEKTREKREKVIAEARSLRRTEGETLDSGSK